MLKTTTRTGIRGASDDRVLTYLAGQIDSAGFEVYCRDGAWSYYPETTGGGNVTDEVRHLIQQGYAKKRVVGGQVTAVITPKGRQALADYAAAQGSRRAPRR